jgi:hypothetical protein
MYAHTEKTTVLASVAITPDVLDYITLRDCDFRVCTSCGGPILLPVRVKPPKRSDLLIKAGSHTVYISIHQARYLHAISRDMIPFFEDADLSGQE